MKKSDVLEQISRCGIVPAIRVSTEEQALRAVEALAQGGISVAEVAMTMPHAARILDHVLARFGDRMLIGAGTVLDAETARLCILAGAQFIVSPALKLSTIELCRTYSTAIFAGALTPTEILAAWTAGADCVKVFPVNAVGGVSYIKAIRAPLPQVQLLPMGGVTLESVEDYIRAGCFALGVGSDLVSASSTQQDGAATISKRAAEYRARIESARKGN
jgi:2-dehydro-3-deoxyphosphogluconate aldolase/(4S)-4-hydroxy-2-oxoglutarate aldolase